jgi:hypothetical protein
VPPPPAVPPPPGTPARDHTDETVGNGVDIRDGTEHRGRERLTPDGEVAIDELDQQAISDDVWFRVTSTGRTPREQAGLMLRNAQSAVANGRHPTIKAYINSIYNDRRAAPLVAIFDDSSLTKAQKITKATAYISTSTGRRISNHVILNPHESRAVDISFNGPTCIPSVRRCTRGRARAHQHPRRTNTADRTARLQALIRQTQNSRTGWGLLIEHNHYHVNIDPHTRRTRGTVGISGAMRNMINSYNPRTRRQYAWIAEALTAEGVTYPTTPTRRYRSSWCRRNPSDSRCS